MSTNRISKFYDDAEEKTAAPPGFTSIPESLLPVNQNVEQIYRAAYEQAIRDARQRLLDLLRSRLTG